MVAYHFPPLSVSSGLQRTLRFAQYLPQLNWEPVILTAHPRAYSGVSQASLGEVPAFLQVRRAFALDAAKHLALRGRFPRFLGVPDRWWSWWLGAVPVGLELIRRFKPALLWSTYPIATAHLIGYTLHRLTGIPWVADFRDPMVDPDYPPDPLQRRVFEWIERQTVKHCARAVFTAPGMLRLYAERYGDIPPSRLALIENGYEESAFAEVERSAGAGERATSRRPILLTHSGTIYPLERDPRAFFAALADLKRKGLVTASDLRITLRATGCDGYVQGLLERYSIADVITLAPSVPYRVALGEMLNSDGLLLLQAANCNYQVPAKLYEYLRARRPIVALTDPRGDTATVLRDAGIDTIAPLDSQSEISGLLIRFLEMLRQQRAPVASEEKIAACSRRTRTDELAKVFEQVTACP